MIVQDVIKEFALLPARAGVMKNFNQVKSDIPEYETLKTFLESDTTDSLFPEITDFVFGLNNDAVNDRIRNTTGPFMLVDYGIVRGRNVLQDGGGSLRFVFSCLIAKPLNSRNADAMEEMLWSDTLLGYVQRMLKHFEAADQSRCATKRMLDGEVTIAPVEPAVLLNCVGWEVSFERNASELME